MVKRFAGTLVVAALVGTAVLWLTTPSRAADGAITGAVTSSNDPEAGVWVIAETTDLPTKFIKTVVTDDDGRYLVPGLPEASYKVWVRGYGLLDSAGVTAEPGETVPLDVTVASTLADAAKIYPANYWYSLIEPPASSEFPARATMGTGSLPRYSIKSSGSTSRSRAACSAISLATASSARSTTLSSSTRRWRPGTTGCRWASAARR